MKKVTLLSTAAAICGLVSFQSAYADEVTPSLELAEQKLISSSLDALPGVTPADIDNYSGQAILHVVAYGGATSKVTFTKEKGYLSVGSDTLKQIPYTLSAPEVVGTFDGQEEKTVTLNITEANLAGYPAGAYTDTITLTYYPTV